MGVLAKSRRRWLPQRDDVSDPHQRHIRHRALRANLYEHPTHPYTQSLLSAVPVPDPANRDSRTRIILEGDIPNPAALPSGCRFHPRCFKATGLCQNVPPAFAAYPGLPTHVACHHAGPLVAAQAYP